MRHPFLLHLLILLSSIVSLRAADPGAQTVNYTADTTTDLMNPERGWHKNVTLIGGDNFAAVRTTHGMTLARTYVRLDDYRNSALPQSFLDEHTLRFSQVRAAGIKLVLRYSYNFSMGADAPIDRVLQHIEQLKPYWRANADVIAVVQAGFIGAWGEWHDSTNGLDTDANRLLITNALLAAWPTSRMVQIRYPGAIRALYPTVVTPGQAFSGTNISRVGFMNDSFLRNTTDAGTYDGPPTWVFDPALWNYAVAMSPSVCAGGETVEDVPSTVGNRQAGPAALAEMATLHWDYLNRDYALSVINPWIADGSYVQMSRKLGYRLRLTSASMPRSAASGSMLSGIQLDLANDGWGKVYNPRRLDLILRNTQTLNEYRIELSADARRLLPLGGQTVSLQLQGQLPLLANGSYTVLLHLADPEAAILNRPEYSIHLANQGLWESATGYHALGMTLDVPGSVVTNAAPQVNAGVDRSIILPDAVTLAGTATDDGLPSGSVLSVAWTRISGPGSVSFAQAGVAATTATFSQAGTYVLQLSASDGALSTQDTVTVVVNAAPVSATLLNGSFESPAVNGYLYNPSGAGWTFVSGSAIQANNSAWQAAAAPDGIQTAVLQGAPAGLGSIEQTVALSAGKYVVNFQAARRSGQVQPVRIRVDGVQVGGLVTPAGNAFAAYGSDVFTVTAGNHVLRLEATDATDDRSTFIDQVSVVADNSASVNGLTGTYFGDTALTTVVTTRTDATIDFDWGAGSPAPGVAVDAFSVRWTGSVQAQYSETYTFTTLSDDGVRLWINGQQLVNHWTDHGPTEDSGSITLVAGQKYDVKMEFYENAWGAVAKLSWASPSTAKQIIPATQLSPTGSATVGLPAGWSAQDVGSVAAAGSSTQANGTWTVSGSGADIWNTSDGFQFVGRQATGDIQVTARVTGLTNTDVWAKAGVMIRDTLTAGSCHVSTFATSANGLVYQRRTVANGASSHTAGPNSAAPAWVRLERIGSVVISSTSADGSTWTEIRRETSPLGNAVFVGLAVTSHNNGQVCTATFTNVQVIAASAAAN